jgi:hypothetical protein
VAGDLYAAEQALITITAGCSVAPNTNMIAIREQRTELFEDVWAWLHLAFSNYPYMVDRIARLREFALQAAREGVQANAPIAVGSLPITHARIRALPLMVIRKEQRDLGRFPNPLTVFGGGLRQFLSSDLPGDCMKERSRARSLNFGDSHPSLE